MEPGAHYVMHLGRRHKVVGWHKAKKQWVLEHPKDPSSMVYAHDKDVIHLKGRPAVDPNQGELFKRGERLAAKYSVKMLETANKVGRGGKRVKLRKLTADALESLARDASPLAHATRPAWTLVTKKAGDTPYNQRLKDLKRQAAASDTSKYHEQQRTKSTPNKYSVTPKKMFDSEKSRKRRSYGYEGAAIGGSAGAAFGAARPAPPDIQAGRKAKRDHGQAFNENMKASQDRFMAMKDPKQAASKGTNAREAYRNLNNAMGHLSGREKAAKELAPGLKVLRLSRAKWGVGAVALAGGAAYIHHQRSNSWRPYTSWHDGSKHPETNKKLKSRSMT